VETTLPLIRDAVIILTGVSLSVALVVLLRRLVPLLRGLEQLTETTNETVERLQTQSEQLGEVLLSARALTDALNETYRRSIEPALANVDEMTTQLNRAVHDVTEVVEEGTRFSRQTIRRATYLRDSVFGRVLDLVSLGHGIWTVARVLPVRRMLRLPGKKKR